MARRLILVLSVAMLPAALCGCIDLAPLVAGRVEEVVVRPSGRFIETNKIAIIDVDGFISTNAAPIFPRHGTTVADVREKLQRAARDGRVRAVVLRINSPGGEVTASDMIHQEITRFRKETGRPVVAMLMGLAASGGYYVAAATDRIVAAPTSVTGSIGVVMHFINVQSLFGKIGLRPEVVKSGDKKDIGSATRAMTPEERRILEDINKAMFDRFMHVVRTGRPALTDADVKVIADGRIISGQQAVDLHLADRTGYLDDAIAEAISLAGISGADVILYRAFPHYNANIYAGMAGAQRGVLEQGLELLLHRQGAAFLYVWSPGLAGTVP